MIILYSITGLALLVSFIANREKTLKALKISLFKFIKIVPPFLVITILVAISLYLIPSDRIAVLLGRDNLFAGLITASAIGSIGFIPGFIVFPLTGILRQQGTSYMVLSAFTTTLMMVGIMTMPLEKEYLGMKITIARNIAGFLMALIVAVVTGLIFGELQL